MRWKTKALVQRIVARLPDRISKLVYFRLQRSFGSMRPRRMDPTSRLRFGLEFCQQIVSQGRSPIGATFFEVGTGWRFNVPIACWLCGADRIVTVDLNRYLRFSLVKEDVQFLQRNSEQLYSRLQSEFGNLIQRDRWRSLVEHPPSSLSEFSSLCHIEYLAPADARHTTCETDSIDFHVSCNVFEHIQADVLKAILQEANRITKSSGLLLHLVDHTDHFSHADASLSPINFLQYSDTQWRRYANHRYAYVNRLREDDYLQLIRECKLEVCAVNSEPDRDATDLLRSSFPLDVRFSGKSPETLSRLSSLFVLAPQSSGADLRKIA